MGILTFKNILLYYKRWKLLLKKISHHFQSGVKFLLMYGKPLSLLVESPILESLKLACFSGRFAMHDVQIQWNQRPSSLFDSSTSLWSLLSSELLTLWPSLACTSIGLDICKFPPCLFLRLLSTHFVLSCFELFPSAFALF